MSGRCETLVDHRERANLHLVGLPAYLRIKPQQCKAEGEAIVAELKAIEAQLTEWEARQPDELLRRLPWYEARERYKRDKAAGRVEEPTWWEALSFVERAYPRRLGWEWGWGGALLRRLPAVRDGSWHERCREAYRARKRQPNCQPPVATTGEPEADVEN